MSDHWNVTQHIPHLNTHKQLGRHRRGNRRNHASSNRTSTSLLDVATPQQGIYQQTTNPLKSCIWKHFLFFFSKTTSMLFKISMYTWNGCSCQIKSKSTHTRVSHQTQSLRSKSCKSNLRNWHKTHVSKSQLYTGTTTNKFWLQTVVRYSNLGSTALPRTVATIHLKVQHLKITLQQCVVVRCQATNTGLK